MAQPVTDCAPASSSAPWSAPLVNDGVSLTGVTEIVNVCSALVSSPPLAVPPLSFASTPIVAVPFAFGGRRVAQRARCRDGGAGREQGRVRVRADLEGDRLGRLVRRALADRRCPARDGLRAGVLEVALVAALGERRLVVDRVDREGEDLDGARVVAAVRRAAVVRERHVDVGLAEGVRLGREGQVAGSADGRLRREEAGVVGEDVEREDVARSRPPGPCSNPSPSPASRRPSPRSR